MRAYLLYELLYVSRAWPVVAALVLLLLLGLVDTIVELRSLSSRLEFVTEFQRRWMNFFMRGATGEYQWLAESQTRMTAELGPADRITYRAPFSQYAVSNYPMLTNTLAQARGGRGVHPDDVNFVDHLVISRGGVLKERFTAVASRIKNPFYLVGRGLRFVVSLPLSVLAWSGLLAASAADRARASLLFRLIQFLVACALLLAALVTIVVGWDAFVKQLTSWYAAFP